MDKQINRKVIYAISGVSNVGKTETIRMFYDKLNKKYNSDIVFEDVIKPVFQSDISVVLKIKDKIIAIESQGDPDSRILITLPEFVKIPADIIVCATRTKGKTVDIVNQQMNNYEIIWIKKEAYRTEANHDSDNNEVAENLIKEIGKYL